MNSGKHDGLRPRSGSNIDGFFSNPDTARPRRPIFKAPPTAPVLGAKRPAKPQPAAATLPGMIPRRPVQAAAATTPIDAFTDQPSGRRPRHPLATDQPPKRRFWQRRKKYSDQPAHPHGKKRIIKRIALSLGVLLLLFVAVFGFKIYKNLASLTGNKNPFSLLSAFKPGHLANQDGRVNILVAGNSADDAGHNGGNLTDSIMVLSLNTRNNTGFILSIPRDLWVSIPGVGHAKINSAYTNGGMNTLQQVVEDNLGITINYQALVNYGAFRDLVNAVGGITINVKSDDPRGIYDPSLDYTSRNCCALAKYPNGQVTLDGKQALNLARARGDAYGSYGYAQSDFTRTQFQRDMLLAVKDKILTTNLVTSPLEVSKLLDAVGANVKTNMQINELQALYYYSKKINDSSIDSKNINTLKSDDTTMLANYTSPDGQSALIPAAGLDDFSDIQAQILKLTSSDPIVREGANIVVLNATDTAGLARTQGNALTSKGMNVVSEDDAPANQATTTYIDNTAGKKSNSIKYLQTKYKATAVTNAAISNLYPSADIIIMLGANVVPNATGTTTTPGQ